MEAEPGFLPCGSIPFWDDDLTLNTNLPSLTRCFRRIIFSLAPNAAFVLLVFSWNIYKLKTSSIVTTAAQKTWLSVTKLLLAGCLILVSLIDLVFWILDEAHILVDLIEAVVRVLTFAVILLTIVLEKSRGQRVSASQFLFFALSFVLQALNFYCEVIDFLTGESTKEFQAATAGVTTLLVTASLICHFFTDGSPDYKPPGSKPSPILDASFPSILGFSWFTGFAWSGFKRSLGFEDLPDLPPFVQSNHVVPRFLRKWQSQLKPKTSSSSSPKKVSLPPVKAEFENGAPPEVKILDPKEETSAELQFNGDIVRTIVKAFGSSFLLSSVLKLLHDIFVFVSPLLLKKIIQFAASEEQLWKGIIYAVGLLLTTSVQSVMLAKYFYEMYLIGIWVRSSLTSSIYRKSLRVSPQGKAESTTGEVVNLMSVDTQRLVDMMPYINMLWSAPLQIAMALYLLWQTLGASVLSGFLIMVLLIPINGAIAAKSRQFQVKQMKHKDTRVKNMNEILQGIKIIKLYGWEPSCEKRIGDVRDKEINILTNLAYLSAGTSFIWSCAPFVVSLVSFATFVLVDENNVLDSQKAFVSLSLFNILRFPLSMLPMMIASMVQVHS